MQPDDLRALRSRYGWTQRDLASRLGTDAVTVSRWERGKSLPRPSAQSQLDQLASGVPAEIHSLVRFVGVARSKMVLKRSILMKRRPRRQRFSANPTRRIRDVERALREQEELKASARLGR